VGEANRRHERLREIIELLRIARFNLALDADVADIDVSDFGRWNGRA
jgi:hypothetical protein